MHFTVRNCQKCQTVLTVFVSACHFVLHAYLFKVAGFSKWFKIELLSVGFSFLCAGISFSSTSWPAIYSQSCSLKCQLLLCITSGDWCQCPRGIFMFIQQEILFLSNITFLNENNKKQLHLPPFPSYFPSNLTSYCFKCLQVYTAATLSLTITYW